MIRMLILWGGRVLLALFVARMIYIALAGRRQASRRSGRPRQVEREGGTLVRDPHCGTYVAQSRAIRVGSGSTTLYFCSTACRDAYLAAERTSA